MTGIFRIICICAAALAVQSSAAGFAAENEQAAVDLSEQGLTSNYPTTSFDVAANREKRFGFALYSPEVSSLALMTKILYVSAEAECNVSRYVSIAMEMRYFYEPKRVVDEETVHQPDGSVSFRNVYQQSQTFYGFGPGLRLYPAGEGMQGVFLAMYYQMLIGTKHGLSDVFEYRIATSWVGYRMMFESIYIEMAAGAVYSSRLYRVNPQVLPLLSLGFGVCF
jgi:hypothetical protein